VVWNVCPGTLTLLHVNIWTLAPGDVLPFRMSMQFSPTPTIVDGTLASVQRSDWVAVVAAPHD
jgi:hypothetical protein